MTTTEHASRPFPKESGCPLDPLLNLLARKWLVHIVWFLGRNGTLRFAELRHQLPGQVSARVLSARLKELEKLAIVEREDLKTSAPHVVYRLSSDGRALDGLLRSIEQQVHRPGLAGLLFGDPAEDSAAQ
jgi:DNA-binding HxlR family transcriptional regulator